jgi:hypothetical protein
LRGRYQAAVCAPRIERRQNIRGGARELGVSLLEKGQQPLIIEFKVIFIASAALWLEEAPMQDMLFDRIVDVLIVAAMFVAKAVIGLSVMDLPF